MRFGPLALNTLLGICAGSALPAHAGRTITIKNLDQVDAVTVRIAEEWRNRFELKTKANEFDVRVGKGETVTESTNKGDNSVLTYWRINGSDWSNLGDLAGRAFQRISDDEGSPGIGINGLFDWTFEVSREAPGAPWKLKMVGGLKR
jgi:hypothetical protein